MHYLILYIIYIYILYHIIYMRWQRTYISTQPWSPLISMAFTCSPAERYICTAAFGSLMSLAQSACFFISIFVSLGSPDPRNSCNSAIQKSALPSHKCCYSLNSKIDKGFCNEYHDASHAQKYSTEGNMH